MVFLLNKNLILESKDLGWKIWPSSLLAVGPWAPYLTFMSVFSYLCDYSCSS